MTYRQTLDFLFRQLPMYQREGKIAFKKDLTNTLGLCKILGEPHQKFKSIHIAGTNGKGSTAHMLASIFHEAGYKTGLYTSPHLKDFRERIRINGKMISQKEVVDFVDQFQEQFEPIRPSFFEWTVALAFFYFAKEKVDIAIIETGLGGRLDSTNIITPELSVITNIGFDHTDVLGGTLDLIAKEKAGIIKNNIPIVVVNHSGQKKVFEQVARERKAPLYFTNELTTNIELKTDLLGNYQKENTKGVFHAWLQLRKQGWEISFTQLESGLKNVVKNSSLRGRWEILQQNPLIIAETAHNEDGLKAALKQLNSLNSPKIHFVLGFVKDKKLDTILNLFPKKAHYYFCEAKIPRALPVNELKRLSIKYELKGDKFNSVSEAVKAAKAKAEPTDTIYIGGSNFVVAEVI